MLLAGRFAPWKEAALQDAAHMRALGCYHRAAPNRPSSAAKAALDSPNVALSSARTPVF